MGIIKECVKPLFFYGGLPLVKRIWRKLSCQQRIFILMYHRIEHHAPPFFEVVVKPDFFERQIRFLKKNFHVVDLCDLKEAEFISNIKKDMVVLTFDDGYRDNYTQAFPILKKYQLPATIFLATDYIDTNRLLWYDKLSWILYRRTCTPSIKTMGKYDIAPEISTDVQCFFVSETSSQIEILRSLSVKFKAFQPKLREDTLNKLARLCKIKIWPEDRERAMLSWDEVKKMSEHGISFGSHTMSHPILSAISTFDARKEIGDSKRAIEEKIQRPVRTFAYPYGKKEDFTNHIIKILADEGFEYACSTYVGAEKYPLKAPLMLRRRSVALSPYLFL